MKNFDPKQAKQLAAGQHILIDGSPGLRLVGMASRTDKSWTYRYRTEDGRLGQVKIGEWPKMSVAAAVAAWEKLRAERDAGRDPGAERRAARTAASGDAPKAKGSPTVADVLRDYVHGHINVHRKAKGAAEVRRMFDKMIPATFAAKDAAIIKRRDAFDLIKSHERIPVQAANLKRELGAAWSYALDSGRLPDDTPNHWRDILRGKLQSAGKVVDGERVTAKRVLSAAELGTLIPWLPNLSRLVEDVLIIYLWTGLRGAEIVAIEGAWVTEEADGWWVTIPKAKTKNAKRAHATDMRTPLVGRAEMIIRRRLGVHGKGALFPSEAGGAVSQKTIQTAVWFHMPHSKTRPQWERPRLPVEKWSPHDLRRSVRTTLAAMGCPSEVAEAILGHVPPGIVGVYNLHSYDAEKREWLTKLSARFEELAAAK
ncbi:tyrosine-type recombinase/integrase [Paraburkholderia strydomiana]|uniref:tyrosine-type recombinase/integrase n=1 Tax=Paraburkholderia strydomiana TaxID=1245417 RepID=UPI0038B9891C